MKGNINIKHLTHVFCKVSQLKRFEKAKKLIKNKFMTPKLRWCKIEHDNEWVTSLESSYTILKNRKCIKYSPSSNSGVKQSGYRALHTFMFSMYYTICTAGVLPAVSSYCKIIPALLNIYVLIKKRKTCLSEPWRFSFYYSFPPFSWTTLPWCTMTTK